MSLEHPLSYYHNLRQNTSEWKSARQEFITASEMSIALQLSTTYTPRKLLADKLVGRERTFSTYVQKHLLQWGVDHEKDGIEILQRFIPDYWQIEETGLHPFVVTAAAAAENNSAKPAKLGASPDRLLVNKKKKTKDDLPVPVAIVEVKCPAQVKDIYKEFIPCWDQIIAGSPPTEKRIPPIIKDEHYVQMQAQMRATGLKEGFYVCWSPKRTIIIKVVFDETLWHRVLEPIIVYFANKVTTAKENIQKGAENTPDDLLLRSDLSHPPPAKIRMLISASQKKNNEVFGMYEQGLVQYDAFNKL